MREPAFNIDKWHISAENPPELASSVRIRMTEEGWPEPVIRMRLREGARARHLWRVDKTLAAAYDYLLEASGIAPDATAMMVLLTLDTGGLGGRGGYEGAATMRLLSGLGKGRWQATDGEAWAAAARQAILYLSASHEATVSPETVSMFIREFANAREMQWLVAESLRRMRDSKDSECATAWETVAEYALEEAYRLRNEYLERAGGRRIIACAQEAESTGEPIEKVLDRTPDEPDDGTIAACDAAINLAVRWGVGVAKRADLPSWGGDAIDRMERGHHAVARRAIMNGSRCGAACAHEADVHDCPICEPHVGFICRPPCQACLAEGRDTCVCDQSDA
jgi:hypothetical protein